jgi:hypothetical protein
VTEASAAVHGTCAPGFEPLREALSEILDSGLEVGAALAVCVDKQPVPACLRAVASGFPAP